ncbi:MAG: RagB/SusD family nutrient uptake outer membrane protein [Flavisolibacter sp.]|nr:RagB/SusD family nutrient uptake outer membrane protein [Flavisolibacter sp.]
MKRLLQNISILIFSGAVLVSCSKKIELEPTNTVNGDKFFTTIDDYDFVLTGAYSRLKQNSLYSGVNGGSIFLSAVDVAADNFYTGGDNLGALNGMFRWNYTADNDGVKGAWDAAYKVIQQANLSVRGINRFRGESPEKVNRIEGQARALRAFMHLEILRWWAPDYDRNSASLGIPYVDAFDLEQMPARPTVKQTYDKMEADLKAAKAMLSNVDVPIQSVTSIAGTGRAYMDSLVVNAILARMYLYASQFDSAIKYSTYVINARPLATATEFPLIWQDATTREVIWSVNYQTIDAPLAREIYRPASAAANDEVSWIPVTALVNSYTGTDVRKPAYFVTRNGITVINKYFAKAGITRPDGIVNFKVFRTAEMYLIRAEALARKGGFDIAALADLNILRAARNAPTGSETGTALLTSIATERRKELFMEGHRFFDLKRTVRTVNRIQDCSSYCTLLPGNRAWALPIPQTEIIANPNMKQNPGY